jgi:Collagen triple helix repeat (20 copies)
MRHSGLRIAVFTVVFLAAALAATVAFGQIPGSDGVIHGCYKDANGNLSVVDESTPCAANETPLEWDAHGFAGSQGPAGPQGPPGPQGPAGVDGLGGADGAAGPQGPQGPAGADGADGAQGPQGPQGPAGADGADGADGSQGPPGPQGLPGPAGADGAAPGLASSTVGPLKVGKRVRALERLDLPAGAYVLLAKISLAQVASHSTRVVCGLTAGGRFDRASVVLAATGDASAQTADLMLSRVLTAPGPAWLRCRYYLSPGQRTPKVTARYAEIAALELQSLTIQ